MPKIKYFNNNTCYYIEISDKKRAFSNNKMGYIEEMTMYPVSLLKNMCYHDFIIACESR